MNMLLTVCMYVVLMALTQSYNTSAFRGTDFAPVFKGPNYAPDGLPGSKLQRSVKRLDEIEKRFDTVTDMESRLDDIEHQLEESKTNDTVDVKIETKMKMVEEELETVQDTLSTLTAVANNVDQLQATVAASSVKTEQDMKSLVRNSAATDSKVTALEAEVAAIKLKLNDTEGKFQKLETDLNSGNMAGDAQQERDARCPSDYMYDGKTKLCLKLVRRRRVISDANVDCLTQADEGRIIQLDTPEKHEFAIGYLRSQGQTTDVAVGGIRDQSGQYTWLDGTPIENGNWCPGQPETRPCVSLWAGAGFCLDDIFCGPMPYLCEVPLDE